MVDNIAAVSIVRSTYSREAHLMHLPQFFASFHGFWFTAEQVPGVDNGLADAISRNNEGLFLSQVPRVARHPTSIPASLVELVAADIAWTSTTWTKLLFGSSNGLHV